MKEAGGMEVLGGIVGREVEVIAHAIKAELHGYLRFLAREVIDELNA
jgi:hypothetical protein